MKRRPMCEKCRDLESKPSPKDAVMGIVPRVQMGCKALSTQEWDDGWYSDDPLRETPYQHNCPVMLAMHIREEMPSG